MYDENEQELMPALPDVAADVLIANYDELCARLPGTEFPEWATLVLGSLFGAFSLSSTRACLRVIFS